MKTIVLATSVFLVACTDEADIGIDSQPVECSPDGASSADMSGTIHYGGRSFTFANATPSLVRDTTGTYTTVNLWSYEEPPSQRANSLRFYFQCGETQTASYDVVSAANQQLACPLEVAGSIAGEVEILPVDRGTLIIDQSGPNSRCLAGRFHVEMDNRAGDGDVSGWFSIFQQ
jgi:hypothetical protein